MKHFEQSEFNIYLQKLTIRFTAIFFQIEKMLQFKSISVNVCKDHASPVSEVKLFSPLFSIPPNSFNQSVLSALTITPEVAKVMPFLVVPDLTRGLVVFVVAMASVFLGFFLGLPLFRFIPISSTSRLFSAYNDLAQNQ